MHCFISGFIACGMVDSLSKWMDASRGSGWNFGDVGVARVRRAAAGRGAREAAAGPLPPVSGFAPAPAAGRQAPPPKSAPANGRCRMACNRTRRYRSCRSLREAWSLQPAPECPPTEREGGRRWFCERWTRRLDRQAANPTICRRASRYSRCLRRSHVADSGTARQARLTLIKARSRGRRSFSA